MSREQKISLLNELRKAGINFYGSVPDVSGQKEVYLTTEDVLDFLTDKQDWFAKQNGVSKQDYISWLESHGTPRCGVILKNGNRCKNVVSGGMAMPLKVWLNEDAGYCRVHGGLPSRNAKS